MQIPQHGRGIFPQDLPVAAVEVYIVGQHEGYAVPGWAVAPCKAPAAGWYNPGSAPSLFCAFATLRSHSRRLVSTPRLSSIWSARQRCVAGPSIFLPVRAVSGEIEEVGQIGTPRRSLQGVDGFIRNRRSFRAPPHQSASRGRSAVPGGLLRCDASNQDIPEAVIGKGRHMGFSTAAAADIVVYLNLIIVVEAWILRWGEAAVIKEFGAFQLDFLGRGAL